MRGGEEGDDPRTPGCACPGCEYIGGRIPEGAGAGTGRGGAPGACTDGACADEAWGEGAEADGAEAWACFCCSKRKSGDGRTIVAPSSGPSPAESSSGGPSAGESHRAPGCAGALPATGSVGSFVDTELSVTLAATWMR